MIRGLSLIAGGLIIAAVCHANVTAAGGYASPVAPLQIALALGLAVGSVAIGRAWATRRWALPAFLGLALVAGDGFALISTAERTITIRDASAAPFVAAAEAHTKAAARVSAAEAALVAVPLTSPRLEAAVAAKAAAEARALEVAAKKTCASNCRALLGSTKADANREVDAARIELAVMRSKAGTALSDARSALATLPAPRSASPLADRLGLQGWQIDLVAAALASLAANGLGAGLLAFAANGREIHAAPVPNAGHMETVEVVSVTEMPKALTNHSEPRGHVARFAVEILRPEQNAALPVKRIPTLYREWAERAGVDLVAPDTLAIEIKALIARAGLVIDAVNGEAAILGVALKEPIDMDRQRAVV